MVHDLKFLMAAVFMLGAYAHADGYLVSAGGDVVRNAYGECVHTAYWEPGDAIVGCDGKVAEVEIVKPVAVVEVVPVEPVEPQIQQVTLDAETYFGFDKSRLTTEAREKLDAVIVTLRGYNDLVQVRIVGHTDRIGNEAYNEQLGRARAESVERYLIERGPLDPEILELRSMGESDPQVRCEDLRGQALIDCLAPNRRVELSVEATEIR